MRVHYSLAISQTPKHGELNYIDARSKGRVVKSVLEIVGLASSRAADRNENRRGEKHGRKGALND